jgi:hypothetical protein
MTDIYTLLLCWGSFFLCPCLPIAWPRTGGSGVLERYWSKCEYWTSGLFQKGLSGNHPVASKGITEWCQWTHMVEMAESSCTG